ncbi:hypothetical protein BSKO_08868 [Bryopsis sp. KO-2023]|nr:hypothetical protein BSKO_08868 [Bryopsis sp. KO-2023]
MPCSDVHRASLMSTTNFIFRKLYVRTPANRRELCCRAAPLPDKGFFKPTDPNAEVLPLRKKTDLTKRGDRWTSEFIWNSDWKSEMEYEEAKKKREEEEQKEEEQKTSGFLSFNRVSDLNDMNVDLSKELERSKQRISARKRMAEEVSTSKSLDKKDMQKLPYIPGSSRGTRGQRFSPAAVRVEDIGGYKQNEDAMTQYEKDKKETQLWTVGLIAFCFGLVYFTYPQDTAASYLVGALGGLWYLRLLNQGVDSVGTGDTGGLASQPRLLVPAILVLGFNRWNTLAADDVGVHLELLSMLVGFFTYKAALVGRQSLQVFSDLVADVKKEGGGEKELAE